MKPSNCFDLKKENKQNITLSVTSCIVLWILSCLLHFTTCASFLWLKLLSQDAREVQHQLYDIHLSKISETSTRRTKHPVTFRFRWQTVSSDPVFTCKDTFSISRVHILMGTRATLQNFLQRLKFYRVLIQEWNISLYVHTSFKQQPQISIKNYCV